MSGQLAPLSLGDFPQFFDELWREEGSLDPYEPFPWQIDLLATVHEKGWWPSLVDLPTGSGKTSLLDIAVFLLAMDASAPPSGRWMPRRVALVVDRRVIVDQADQRGAHLVTKLQEARAGVVWRVAQRLRSLSAGRGSVPGGPPLVNTVLRGGIVRDESWAFRPDVPALISSTVDQVGSRLLFRGYGISRGTRPIHAGLLGNDTLFLLDEVHLARPFAQTLSMVDQYRKHGERNGVLPDRWQVVQLTATPGTRTADTFPVGVLDAGSHPVLARRLHASKPARLEEVRVTKDSDKSNDQFADACVRELGVLLASGARTLGVIVNRVDTARRVARKLMPRTDDATSRAARLLKLGSGQQPPETVLLTGRMRSMDRDRVVQEYESRIRMGRVRSEQDGSLVVVATQSIEAGADFDLDGIVTECASLDALRQRFGRVDRDGQLSASGTPTQSVVLIRSTDTEATTPDPVYGATLRRTWEWLKTQEAVDFGINALTGLADDECTDGLLPEPEDAPLLFPRHMDAWVQTSQPPSGADPDVARWLHGLDVTEETADVDVIWRCDLDESLFSERPDHDRDHYQREISERVASCPPAGAEALSVPLNAFRRWARGGGDDLDISDVGGIAAVPGDEGRESQRRPGWALRWLGGAGELVSPSQVRPGDTVVVPATRGGIWQNNWDPSATGEVDDLAEASNAVLRRRAVVRLIPQPSLSTGSDEQEAMAEESDQLRAAYPDPEKVELLRKPDRREGIMHYLRWARDSGHLGHLGHRHDVVEHLLGAKTVVFRPLTHRLKDGTEVRSYVVSSPEPMVQPGQQEVASVADEDGQDASSFLGTTRATLRDHLIGVGDWAAQLGENLGVPKALTADLRLAGRLHDVGKLDRRFQLWLNDGDEVMAAASRDEPLAKSRTSDTDWQARREAQRRSGYPTGARHELLSTALIANGLAEEANDPALISYLVGSHHGYGRYRSTAVEDPDPGDIEWDFDGQRVRGSAQHGLDRLDRGIPDRFWQMVRRYGWFQLAWLEAILRLADHSRSRQEQILGSARRTDSGDLR